MTTKTGPRFGYQAFVILAVVVGVFGIVSQFFPGWDFMPFIMSFAVITALIAGSKAYEDQERQKLERSYKIAIEWLLMTLFAAFVFIESSRWLPIEGAVVFLNGHWPGFLIAIICLLMGIAGFQKSSA